MNGFLCRFFAAFVLTFCLPAMAEVDFTKIFSDRDACFVISNVETGKIVAHYNRKRCEERFSPCSTFKIPAALMAFDSGVLKDENQIVKWDGTSRERPELNQDQTPLSWMKNSVKWVTEWIMPQLGLARIQKYLDGFAYGNKDFSGGLKDAWVTSSLKISALEQITFLSRLWKNQLPASQRAMELTKKIIFIKSMENQSELYGKTGTGCLAGQACLDRPGRMLGSFVGFLKTTKSVYVFAANASDLQTQGPPAGPRLRQSVVDILSQLKLE